MAAASEAAQPLQLPPLPPLPPKLRREPQRSSIGEGLAYADEAAFEADHAAWVVEQRCRRSQVRERERVQDQRRDRTVSASAAPSWRPTASAASARSESVLSMRNSSPMHSSAHACLHQHRRQQQLDSQLQQHQLDSRGTRCGPKRCLLWSWTTQFL